MKRTDADFHMASSVRPRFRTAWRGYDPGEVERFLEDLSAERQYLHERVASLEALCAQQREWSTEAILRAARAEADAIRTKADEDAHRLLESAEHMAARVTSERLEAGRHELSRLNAARNDVQQWIKSSVAAIGQAHDLLSAQITLPSVHVESPPLPDKAEAIVELPSAVSRPRPSRVQTIAELPPSANVGGELYEPAPVPFVKRRYALIGVLVVAGLPTVFTSASTLSHRSASIGLVGAPIGSRAIAPLPQRSLAKSVPQAPPEDEGLVLAISAKRNCWIRTVVDGAQPMERVMKAGEAIFVHAHDEALVRVGDGTALNVTINGQTARPLGRDGQAVTRRITRGNYKSLLES